MPRLRRLKNVRTDFEEAEATREELDIQDSGFEIREINRDSGWLSRDKILQTLSNSELEQAIRYYRGITESLERELSGRPMANNNDVLRNPSITIKDIGSFRFLDSTTNFKMGYSGGYSIQREKRNSRRLGNRGREQKSMALRKKMNNFIESLNISADAKTNLLEEWEKLHGR